LNIALHKSGEADKQSANSDNENKHSNPTISRSLPIKWHAAVAAAAAAVDDNDDDTANK